MAYLDADVHLFEVDRAQSRWANAQRLWGVLSGEGPWDLAYLESTGIAGGGPLIRAAQAWGQRYVVSTGDPVRGYFRTVEGRALGAAFGVYERALYRRCAGFVGWTPYLTGRALELGAPRAVTVEGGADIDRFRPVSREERAAAKEALGLRPDHLVLGTVGSLRWSSRQEFCYGLELVETLKRLQRSDVDVLIVGDGDGRSELERRLSPSVADRVVFTGRIPAESVPAALHAMDVGFITQTLDELGSYRLTTKLPEYLAAGLPVAMSPIPGYYDYVEAAGWALPAHHPADPAFHDACARWVEGLGFDEIEERRSIARTIAERRFDYRTIAARFARFVHDLL